MYYIVYSGRHSRIVIQGLRHLSGISVPIVTDRSDSRGMECIICQCVFPSGVGRTDECGQTH